MAVHKPAAIIAEENRIVAAPAAARPNRGTRPFDLHPAVHLMVIGAWTAFVGILALAFMGPDLVVPAGIILVSVIALFLVPGSWGRLAPDDGVRKQSWAEFLEEGMECITGKLTCGQAMAQILTLPVLLLGMAMFFAALKATL